MSEDDEDYLPQDLPSDEGGADHVLDRRQCARTCYMAYARERARQGRPVPSYEQLDELEVEAWMSAGRASAISMMTTMMAIGEEREASDQEVAHAIQEFERGAREEYEEIQRRKREGR